MKILIRNQQRRLSLNETKITKAADKILSILAQPDAELSILFVGDRKMSELNSAYRGISKSTDVLSFEAHIPVSPPGCNDVLGDIVINMHRAGDQAREYGWGLYDEIYRLLVHGTLHLLGYDHEKSAYHARKMRKKEEELLSALKTMDSER